MVSLRISSAAQAGQQLLEAVLDHAAGQHFRRVVGGRLLAVAAGQAEDEASPLVLLAPSHAARRLLVDKLVRLVAVELVAADEVGLHILLGRVRVRGLDLVESLLGKEARVGEQPLVDRAQLVDAKLRVGDAPAAGVAPLAFLGERERLDDLLPDAVAHLDAREQRRAGRVKEVGVQPLHAKAVGVVDGLVVIRGGQRHLPLGIEAVVDQTEELGQAVVEEVAVLGLGRVSGICSRSRSVSRL